ncbi:hypothetical protein [Acholeplasma palmae]|uniref:hypothetical protein n=1 Tax=Acholeplasma palmae TaxID=38986 RepID=UPI0012FE9577|nr:hypothetical protein [Alteracholeplasma palmae]
MITIEIYGFEFLFNDSNSALVWNDCNFYELREEYNNGIINKDNLLSISNQTNKYIKN